MSRKNYVAIAAIFNERLDSMGISSNAIAELKRVAEDMADHFKADNAAFKRDRFLSACGFEQ